MSIFSRCILSLFLCFAYHQGVLSTPIANITSLSPVSTPDIAPNSLIDQFWQSFDTAIEYCARGARTESIVPVSFEASTGSTRSSPRLTSFTILTLKTVYADDDQFYTIQASNGPLDKPRKWRTTAERMIPQEAYTQMTDHSLTKWNFGPGHPSDPWTILIQIQRHDAVPAEITDVKAGPWRYYTINYRAMPVPDIYYEFHAIGGSVAYGINTHVPIYTPSSLSGNITSWKVQ